MTFPHNVDALGQPDLKMGGLQIWVHGQESARPAQAYDANWLRVTAHCGADGASVWASGAILTTSGVERFGDTCKEVYESLKGTASLESYEPKLVAKVSALVAKVSAADRPGHIEVTVEITPDHASQFHRFRFDLDKTHAFDIARQCGDIVERFPSLQAPT